MRSQNVRVLLLSILKSIRFLTRNRMSLITDNVNRSVYPEKKEGKKNTRDRNERWASSLSEIRAIRRATVQTSVTKPCPLNGGEERESGNVLKRALLKSGLILDWFNCRSSCAASLLDSPRYHRAPFGSPGNKSRRKSSGRCPRFSSPTRESGVITDVGN